MLPRQEEEKAAADKGVLGKEKTMGARREGSKRRPG